MQIAVIDNDPQQRALMMEALTAAGHDCEAWVHDEALIAKGMRDGLDLLVFHWQPEAEGLRWLKSLRQTAKNLPILLVTGRAADRDFADALLDGPSDYLVKPVRRSEVALRARVLVARTHPAQFQSDALEFGDFAFDVRAARLTVSGTQIGLTQKEFDLALLFFRNLGRPLSRATILESVWSQDTEFNSRTMDTHVSRIRSKLGLRPERGFRLAPVYSYGYRLEKLGA
jgi:DNA-binding response OmpR family regulator